MHGGGDTTKFKNTQHAQPGQSKWAVRAGLSKLERARDPGPRMVYARREEQEPWFRAMARSSEKEAHTMKVVQQVLQEKSELMKQHKQEMLERIQDLDRAALKVATATAGLREQVLHEVMEDLVSSCSDEEDSPTAEGGGSYSREKLPPTETLAGGTNQPQGRPDEGAERQNPTLGAQWERLQRGHPTTKEGRMDLPTTSQGALDLCGQVSSEESERTTPQSAQLMAASRQPVASKGLNAQEQCQNGAVSEWPDPNSRKGLVSEWPDPSTGASCERAEIPQKGSRDPTAAVNGTLASIEEEETEESVPATCRSAQQAAASEQQTIPRETERGSATAEGGGNDCSQALPPEVRDPAKDKRLRELVKQLSEGAPEGQEARLERIRQQLGLFAKAVKRWPEEVQAKPTRLMMAAENDATEEETPAKLTEFEDLWEACSRAQTPDEAIVAAAEGQQNDDTVQRRCLFLPAPARAAPQEGRSKSSWSRALETLLDSGASRDFVNEETVRELGLKVEKARNPLQVQMADGRLKKVSKVVHLDLKLDRDLVYRTRAYVMGLGPSCDAILGWSFYEAMRHSTFDAANRTLRVERNGRVITLQGRGCTEARQRDAANAMRVENPGYLEIIPPEEGARDLLAFRKAAKAAAKAAKAGGHSANAQAIQTHLQQYEPLMLTMRLSKEEGAQDENNWIEMPVQGQGRYRVSISGVQEQLREAGADLLFHVDVSADLPQVYLINAEDRDELYHFGTGKGAEVKAVVQPKVSLKPQHQRLVEDVLNNRVGPGIELDVAQYALEDIIQTARNQHDKDKRLVQIFEELVKKNLTLGDEFWTLERRERLTEQVTKEFDAVIQNEIRFTADSLNEHLEAAPIRLKEDWDGRAPFERARRMSPQELEVVREQLAELLEKGYIVPSASPFGAAVMCIPKPGQPGKFRMVIDYRRLNALTVADRFPLPDIQELIDDVGTQGFKFWCSFDLTSGFYNVPIYPEHRERTAMSTPFGTYEWLVLPMGLKNAPSIFQRNIQRIFKDLPAVRCFIDDGIIGGRSVEELYMNLRKVLEVLRDNKMVIKRSKLQFFQTSLKFLGHNISREGVSPQAEKVEAVRSWPIPLNKSELRSFLGLFQYYAGYVYNAADKAKPLHDLTKDDASVPASVQEWEEQSHLLKAFNDLKYCLCHAPVLILPDYAGARDGTRPFLVQTDASEAAMGGVIMQDQGKGYQPIAFGSKSFSPAETNYSVTERELLALVYFTTERWRHYLYGCSYQLQGDHRALITLLTPGRAVNRRQARWIEVLQEQNVPQMEYVPGPKLSVPDALSRRPDYMRLIPTARQGLQAEPRNARAIQGSGQSAEADEEYFTSKTRPSSMPPRDTLLPPTLAHAPKAPTLDAILSKGAVQADPTLPTGVMPHGKVCALTENGGGDPTPQTVPAGDICRQVIELLMGVWCAPMEDQPMPELEPWVPEPASLAMLRDNQDWQVHPREFQRWDLFYKFTVDACADKGGRNAQLPKYWTDCLKEDWRGHRIWCNPPYTAGAAGLQIVDVIQKFKEARRADPTTAACFMLPYFQGTAWEQVLQELEGAECVYTYPAGSRLFYAPDGGNPTSKWPVQVWWCPPMRERQGMAMAVTTRKAQQEQSADEGTEAEPRVATEGATMPRLVNFMESLVAAQGADEECRKWAQEIESNENSGFCKAGKMLWRTAEGRYQLVLPAEPPTLRDKALIECHEAPMAGHLGKHRTLAVLRQRFWWPNMARDVAERCKACRVCQQTKVNRQKPALQLHHATLAMRRWQEVNVDFITGLALTERGHDAIMTVTDRLSKMVHFIPLRFKGSDSQRIARLFIDHIWRLHGMPMKVFSDRDPRFTSAFWQEMTRLTGMMSGMTTSYHPSANGGAERTNASLEQILRAYVGDLGADWDLHLSAAEYAMNNSPARATGQKPFVMMYGESPSTQLDHFVQQVLETEGIKAGYSPQAKQFVRDWQRRLQRAYVQIMQTQKADKKAVEKRSNPPHRYQVGQRVMLSSKALTSPGDRGTKWKLRAQYYGPLTVTGIRRDPQGEPAAYQLELPRQWRVHRWFAEEKLKPFYVADSRKWPSLTEEKAPPTQLVDGREEFVVDRILGHRVERDRQGNPRMQWLISWKGYGPVHDEWRSAEDINTGGMELDVWREYEDWRKLKEMSEREEQANWSAARNRISSIRDNLKERVQTYLEGDKRAHMQWQDQGRPLRVLVLYSGTGSVEDAILERYPNAITVSVDSDPQFRPTHCCTVRQWMEAEGGMESYPPGFFDIIWASPPCTEYSRAKTTGAPVPYPVNAAQPHRDLVAADDNVRAAREVMEYLKPRYWFIENPVGYLVTRPLMRDINHLRHLCTYCKYGTPYRKATHLWTNAILTKPLQQCTMQTPCAVKRQHGRHLITAQSGDSKHQQGSGGAVAVYPVPAALIDNLLDNMPALRRDSELAACSVHLISSIWEGEALQEQENLWNDS